MAKWEPAIRDIKKKKKVQIVKRRTTENGESYSVGSMLT